MSAVVVAMDQPVPAFTPLSSMNDAVTDICWDGESIVNVGLANGEIHRISTASGTLLQWQAHDGGVVRVCQNPASNTVASAGEDGRVVFWNHDADHIAELANEPVWIEQLAWNASGEVLAASAGKTIFLWRGAESIGAWYDGRRHVLAMDWAPHSEKLATATNKGLYMWRLGKEEPVELMSFPGAAVSVKWKPSGRALAVGTQDGFLQIWVHEKNGKSRQLTMSGYAGKVNCLCWHPRSDRIATAGGKDVVIWKMQGNGKKSAMPLAFHRSAVTALEYSPAGKCLASGDRDGLVCLWGDSGELMHSFEAGADITSLEWNGSGKRLVVGDINGTLLSYSSSA